MRRAFAIVAITTLALAGCTSSPAGSDDPPQEPPVLPTVDDDGTVHVDVPVDIVVLGFPADQVNELRASLVEEKVEHAGFSYARFFATDRLEGAASYLIPVPIVPTAKYRIHAFEEMAEEYWALAMTQQVDGLINATAIEAWLAEELTKELAEEGIATDPDRPVLVVVHADDRMGAHRYRYHGNVGHLDNVRLFGERHPFIVLDLSAETDPYVGAVAKYQEPVEPGQLAAATESFVRDITHFRLLQGAIYPITTKACHAVTLILGVRATAVTDVLPGFTPAAQAVALERLHNHFVNLTGADVHVDLKVLRLPVDDPVLDAITRDRQDLSTFRYWLDENWDQYWVAHEGCEPYVSFALYGDFGDQPTSFSGIALYDVDRSHRISFSIVSDLTRLQSEWPGFHEAVDGYVSTAQAGRDPNEWFNRLFSHETGHLFGQRHPHDITEASGGGGGNRAFSSVWSTMSYQVRGVMDDFGAIDQANFARNRAGFTHQAVFDAGLAEGPEYEQALALLGQHEWRAAGDIFVAMLQEPAAP